MRTLDAYDQARAIIADPRTTPPGLDAPQLRRLLRALVAEIDWQRTRADLELPCRHCTDAGSV